MILFLTSSPFGRYRATEPTPYVGFNPQNQLEQQIQAIWPDDAKILLVASNPDAYAWMDQIRNDFIERMEGSSLSWSTFDIIDHRYQYSDRLSDYDVVFLAGGHVLTQNHFLHEIQLAQELKSFDGIVIGISAGSMNCAKMVYVQPEEPGESVPSFPRFTEGLGLIETNILPHYDVVKDDILDGKRLFEDITYADSHRHAFLCLTEGSYLLKKDGHEIIYGETYWIVDGQLRQNDEKS